VAGCSARDIRYPVTVIEPRLLFALMTCPDAADRGTVTEVPAPNRAAATD
jgi:hypothetical protein